MTDRSPSAMQNRSLCRVGLYVHHQEQLELFEEEPVTVGGLSEAMICNGRLLLNPDFDALSWMARRYIDAALPDRWIAFSRSELAKALYKDPSSSDRRRLSDTLRRIHKIQLQINEYRPEAPHGVAVPHVDLTHLLDRVIYSCPEALVAAGLQVPKRSTVFVQFSSWYAGRLDQESERTALPWDILRGFGRNSSMAKRLWIYLQAERYTPYDQDIETSWIRLGDRFFNCLQARGEQRKIRDRLKKQMIPRILEADARYVDLRVEQRGKRYELHVYRYQRGAWLERRSQMAPSSPLPVGEGVTTKALLDVFANA